MYIIATGGCLWGSPIETNILIRLPANEWTNDSRSIVCPGKTSKPSGICYEHQLGDALRGHRKDSSLAPLEYSAKLLRSNQYASWHKSLVLLSRPFLWTSEFANSPAAELGTTSEHSNCSYSFPCETMFLKPTIWLFTSQNPGYIVGHIVLLDTRTSWWYWKDKQRWFIQSAVRQV